jgi:hypothetical protein
LEVRLWQGTKGIKDLSGGGKETVGSPLVGRSLAVRAPERRGGDRTAHEGLGYWVGMFVRAS